MKCAAALAAIGALIRIVDAQSAAACPVLTQTPYRNEASPFGWPVTLSDFDYSSVTQVAPPQPIPADFDYSKLPKANLWSDKYVTCGGVRQSPIDLDFTVDDADPRYCPWESEGDDGRLAARASYLAIQGGSLVSVSSYLRTVYAQGNLGTLVLDDGIYTATQIHVTSPSFHTIQGQRFAGELMILHVPQGQKNGLNGSLMLSVLLSVGGDANPILTAMGFADDEVNDPTMNFGSWAAKSILDLPVFMTPVLPGGHISYNGSLPVPPCTENVKWIVMGGLQSTTQNQVNKLAAKLQCYAGGTQKRETVMNPVATGYKIDEDTGAVVATGYGICRKILWNSLQVGGPHDQATCQTIAGSSLINRTAACWGSDKDDTFKQKCSASPIDIKTAKAHIEPSSVQANSFMFYKPVTEVIARPSNYSLDIRAVNRSNLDNFATFGYLMLGGRKFKARNISIKAISSHSYDGIHYAGELNIVHTLYGDDLHDLYNLSLFTQKAGMGRRAQNFGAFSLPSYQAPIQGDNIHRVVVSIPLVIGAANPLFLSLGAGQQAYSGAVGSGSGYDQQGLIDLNASLQSVLAGSFYWYSGGLSTPGCALWGVRWLLFENPLTVSIDQLNVLNLPVSGVDSTRINKTQIPDSVYPYHVWKNSFPPFAVDDIRGAEQMCKPVADWNYSNISCWAATFPLCASGRNQSPININSSSVSRVGGDNFLARTAWHPVKGLRVANSGKSLGIYNEQMGYVMHVGLNGFPSYYELTQLNLHMPSEHLVDGKQFAAELSIAHKNQRKVYEVNSDDVLITTFFFSVGLDRNPLLDQLLGSAPIAVGRWAAASAPIDLLRSLGPALDGNYYRYNGSLTTPPCSEIVKYFVFERALNMSQDQWLAFKAMFPSPSNNRPVQALNGRPVAKNSYVEGSLQQLDFYFRRDAGANRVKNGPVWIIVPCLATGIMAVVIMLSVFVKEDHMRKIESQGGLVALVRQNRPPAASGRSLRPQMSR